MSEAPEAERQRYAARRRSCAIVGVGCALAVVLALGAVLVAFLQYPIRTALSTLDARSVLVPGPEVSERAAVHAMTEAAPTVRWRLRHLGIPARVTLEGARLIVEHRAEDTTTVEAVACPRGALHFMLVVEGLTLDKVSEIVTAQRRDPSAADDRYEVAWQDGAPVILERPGLGGRGTFTSAYRTLDADGRLALGFELAPRSADAMFALTSSNAGRRLAIVLDREVRSTPTIAGAIRARGLITVSDEAEAERLIALLKFEPLPLTLVVEPPPGR